MADQNTKGFPGDLIRPLEGPFFLHQGALTDPPPICTRKRSRAVRIRGMCDAGPGAFCRRETFLSPLRAHTGQKRQNWVATAKLPQVTTRREKERSELCLVTEILLEG